MSEFTFPSDQDRADNDELDRVCAALEEVMSERDQMAAHAALLAEWIKEHGWHPDTCDIMDLDEQVCHKSCSCGLGAIYETPEVSLASRDLLMKAEALEDQASEMIAMNDERSICNVHGAAKHLQGVAAEYREQAEGES